MKNNNYKGRHKQAGVSMFEAMLMLPIMLIVGFGIVHGGLVFQAQSNLEYAALMAARVGASSSINIQQMINEVEFRMRPTTSVDGGDADVVADQRAKIQIEVLNPTRGMFADCGRQPSNPADCFSAACEIPYFGMQFYDRNDPNNSCRGASIQDANILRIRVTYTYDSKVPFLSRIRLTGAAARPEDQGIDISAVATVRMQSPARLTLANEPFIYSEP
ncbi:TadE family protein [Ketobacter alkanivorans]|uniref:TadE-like domain-containing protein n=1 Tax=Ketobacter alkanivorans TaxID=1917421 RepID=A0A2K9LGI4_9GAMM|nr:TadE family protein [Ketobacter alkanivorans]AUM11271.1 hypothetical protein Kalk_01985 [Ketobacter alkanivorans]